MSTIKNILVNKNFINLCLNSELSSEITLQPIKRYNLDSAIIFSDILLIPYALGQNVKFIKDKGPILSEFNISNFLKNNREKFTNNLEPIYQAIKKTRKNLKKEKSLISFIGAPWTLLVYMFGLKESKNEINLLKFKNKKNELNKIMDSLIKYSCLHIENQIEAGADLVQIFDSWAGLLPDNDLEDYCYKANLESGMHPLTLLKPKEQMYSEAKKYLDIFKDVPYIFNLGHGIVPETNPDQLGKLIEFVKGYK